MLLLECPCCYTCWGLLPGLDHADWQGPHLVSELQVQVLYTRVVLVQGQLLEEGDDLLLPEDALQAGQSTVNTGLSRARE